MEAFMMLLGTIGGVTLFVIADAFIRGFIFYKFWYWFVLPAFTQLPAISITHAVGLMLITVIFTAGRTTTDTTDELKKEKVRDGLFIGKFVVPWLLLLIGWVAKEIFM